MKKKRRIFCWLITVVLCAANCQLNWAQTPCKFPPKIHYKILIKDKAYGSCDLVYEAIDQKKKHKKKRSVLNFANIRGPGIPVLDQWRTVIFLDDLSLCLDSQIEADKIVFESKIRERTGPKGKEKILIYSQDKAPKSIKKETIIFNPFKIISVFSSFLVASQRVALGHYKNIERFNLVVGPDIKVAEMKYQGQEMVFFQGKQVPAQVISLTIPNESNRELLKMKIYKAPDDYCFPIAIDVTYLEGNSFELKADHAQLPRVNKILPPMVLLSLSPSNEKPLTIENVYQVISENEFYCNSPDDPYHLKVLNGLTQSKKINPSNYIIKKHEPGKGKDRYSYTFKSGWEKQAIILSEFIVKTKSVKKNDPSERVILYWLPSEVGSKTYDYPKALKRISQLNQQEFAGYSDWRIPTLKEILYIIGDEFTSGNFFPFNNSEGKFTNTIKILTSTLAAKKESKNLKKCDEDAYFVFNNIHNDDLHHIDFDIACKSESVYLLPVRSYRKEVKRKSFSPILNSPINRLPSVDPSYRSSLAVAYFGFIDFIIQTSITYTYMGGLIDEAVLSGIHRTAQSSQDLSFMDIKSVAPDAVGYIDKLSTILFDFGLTRREKIDQMIDELMVPNGIDIIVAGLYIRSMKKTAITLRPMVIVKSTRKILSKNLEFRMDELVCDNPSKTEKIICEKAYNKITQAIKELLEQI